MNDFNMTFDSGEDLNMGFRELQVEVPMMHNDLSERAAENAHPMSAITGLEAKFAEAFAAIEEKVNKAYVDGEIARVEGEIPSLDGYATERYVDEAVAEVQSDLNTLESEVDLNTSERHSHGNKSVLDTITQAMITAIGTIADKYVKPLGGIPKSDLSEGVKSSLDKADNSGTYSKPDGGIPKTDLSEGVKESLELADNALQIYNIVYTEEE